MSDKTILFLLTGIIILLTGIVFYQRFIFTKGIQTHLENISKDLENI